MKPLSFYNIKDFVNRGARYVSMTATGEIQEDAKEKIRIGSLRRRFVLEPERAFDLPVVPGEHLTPSGALSTKEATRKWLATLDPYVFVTPKEMDEWSLLANACHEYPDLWNIIPRCRFELSRQVEAEGLVFSAKAHMLDDENKVHAFHTTRDFNEAVKNIRDLYQLEQLTWTADLFDAQVGSIFVAETEGGQRVRQFFFDPDVLRSAAERVKRWTAAWYRAKDDMGREYLPPKTLSYSNIKGA
jgi:hypothetical protein